MLADVRVIAIDQLLARGVAPATELGGAGRTVTLEVTSAQAERVAVAVRLGRLSLAVRSADSSTRAGVGRKPPACRPPGAGDVSPALGRPSTVAAKDAGASLRLFQGGQDGKGIPVLNIKRIGFVALALFACSCGARHPDSAGQAMAIEAGSGRTVSLTGGCGQRVRGPTPRSWKCGRRARRACSCSVLRQAARRWRR